MMTFYDLLNVISLDYCVEVYDVDGYLIQDGVRGMIMWQDDLLDIKVRIIYPHNETIRVILEEKYRDD